MAEANNLIRAYATRELIHGPLTIDGHIFADRMIGIREMYDSRIVKNNAAVLAQLYRERDEVLRVLREHPEVVLFQRILKHYALRKLTQ